MMAGSMFRSRTKEKEYIDHRKKHKSDGCDFCQLVKYHTDQVVGETAHCLIIKNRFGYNFWDGCGVDDHLMVIHQHTHLIKIDGKTKKWLIFLQKPHIVITR